jgi:ABC-type polar amino acid transport system ATPase subunit
VYSLLHSLSAHLPDFRRREGVVIARHRARFSFSHRAGEPYPRETFGRIGVVFQEHNLFPHMTVLQNVRLGLTAVRRLAKPHANKRAMEELDQVGLGAKANAYPSTLSGGERQRVAIARSLAMEPLFLILDEPTSGLDPARVFEVKEILSDLSSKGTTVLLITHHIRFARSVGDRFAVLEKGVLTVSSEANSLDRLEEDWD